MIEENQIEAKWVICPRFYDYEADTYACSMCRFVIRSDEKSKMKYCPNCGAHMEGNK
jgi:rubrerythrin